MAGTPYMVEVFNMTLPPEGPGAIPIVIDFDGISETEVDLTQLVNDGLISYVSGVQVDLLDIADGALQLECNGTGQRLQASAGGITFLPLFLPNPPKISVRAIDGLSGVVRLHFLNFPIWPFGNSGGSGGGGAIGPIAGPEMTTATLELDGSSQEIAAVGAAASYFLIQNQLGASPIYVNLGGGDAVAVGLIIQPGGSLELPNGTASAITVSGTAADIVIYSLGA